MSRWDQQALQSYIDNVAEESQHLEYKAADALGKSDGKKAEITKDVSAMANADGGIIIYGIKEYKDPSKRHLPERLDGVDRTLFPKEWLNQVIDSIEPRISGITINSVNLSTGSNHAAYVVEIPKSTTAHQARDMRYYRRYNFECLQMHDHEIRDVMSRMVVTPEVDVQFGYEPIETRYDIHVYSLRVIIANKGRKVVNHTKLVFTFPDLNLLKQRHMVIPNRDVEGALQFDPIPPAYLVKKPDEPYYSIEYRSSGVLFPDDQEDISRLVNCRYWVNNAIRRVMEESTLCWRLCADDMPPKNGKTPCSQIHCF